MNFFKLFLILLFLFFSTNSFADNHAQDEIAQEISEDEEGPLNDPFAGNEGTGGALNSHGATGFGVRLLNELVEENYEK